MTKPLVELDQVEMIFNLPAGQLQAGRRLNLTINPGDMVAVIGESGCGKSTLGKLVLGLQGPSGGEVRFSGQNIWAKGFRMPAAMRLGVQVIHQDPFSSLNPVRTVYQTLAPILRHHKLVKGRAQARQAVAAVLDQVGLTPSDYFIDKYPFQLSGGQKQRVSIARATLLKPQLIVADEPVSAVDSSLRLVILDLMKHFNQEQGTAFVYITHDLATARYFAPQGTLIVMYLGRMVETGPIGDCIGQPAHPYLHALLAAIPGSATHQPGAELPLRSLDMPSALNPPSGCVFHPRCPHADAKCQQEEPLLSAMAGQADHQVACHYAERLQYGIQRAS